MKWKSKMPEIVIKQGIEAQVRVIEHRKIIGDKCHHTDEINLNGQFFAYFIHPNVAHDVAVKKASKIGVKEI